MCAYDAPMPDSDTTGLVLPFPYVPTLGPVHPDALNARLWDEVLAANGTGVFLPHDKDARWDGSKDETVLIDAMRRDRKALVTPPRGMESSC